jgi:hypothetical protein
MLQTGNLDGIDMTTWQPSDYMDVMTNLTEADYRIEFVRLNRPKSEIVIVSPFFRGGYTCRQI